MMKTHAKNIKHGKVILCVQQSKELLLILLL